MKLSELQAQLDALNTQLAKAKDEIVAEVANLQTQLSNVDIPADAQASLDKLKGMAQALDDLNPDAPTAPSTPASPA